MLDAMKSVKDKTPDAFRAMQEVMEERPVLVNRAPVLHKYGIMAFRPVLTQGKAIETSPLVTAPFNLDFDGDTMGFHVPVSKEAVEEAYEKLLPSKNLIYAQDMTSPTYTPSQQFLHGLWLASVKSDKSKPVRVYRSKEDALAAYKRGEIKVGQRVKIS
jgi:DNA-directed RNA polymerase subunit beta'